jgi:hypothetical protein
MHDLALHTARRAQRAFNRERGHTGRRFLPDPGWENLHEALLAGEHLQLALCQMETAYLDLNCREYELTKHLSLRLDFPLAYLHLRQAGWAEIEIAEWMFDLDFPGMFMRCLKNVTMTIPCVAGPYTGVHCKLTLVSSATRVDPRLAGPLARAGYDIECAAGRSGHVCTTERSTATCRRYAMAIREISGTSACRCLDARSGKFSWFSAMSRCVSSGGWRAFGRFEPGSSMGRGAAAHGR